jgi:membrane protein DedA with SNARE-associated domain
MKGVIPFLIQHGYAIVFIWVFGEQIGLPVPATPMLLAAGALAGEGQLNFAIALGVAALGALLSDVLWYLIGRYRGGSVLSWICKVSLTPDSCIRHTEEIFSRHGPRSLLVAKFIPGLNTAAPSLAGIFHMPLARFFLFDCLGVFFWAGAFVGLGYVFSNQIEQIAIYALRLGTSLILVILGGLAAYILWKYLDRRQFLKRLYMARVTPEELKQKLDGGEDLTIFDMRHSYEFEADPQTIPGAVHLSLERLEKGDLSIIPRDREVILYCN